MEKLKTMKRKFLKIPEEQVQKIVSEMVEIELPEAIESDNFDEKCTKLSSSFMLVKEVLQRIGYLKNNKIYQTAHILKKRGKYYICHFKQLFQLDGLNSSINETDYKRLHKIAYMLDSWGMIKVLDRKLIENVKSEENNVYINIVPIEKIKSGEILKIKKYEL